MNELQVLRPQLAVAAGLAAGLLAGMMKRIPGGLLRVIGFSGLLGAIGLLLATRLGISGPLLQLDEMGLTLQFLFLAAALPVVFFLDPHDEVPLVLTLGSVLGMGVLAASGHLLMLFIGLELMSLPAYLLVAKGAQPGRATEAGLKYFFAGSVAGSLYLLGMTLHYASAKSLSLTVAPGTLGDAGLLLMGAAALFKLGAVPLHFWLPDVYEASAPELAGFFSTGMKAAAVLLLMRLTATDPHSLLARALPWIGGVTALFGALAALRQQRLQRLLAYSSISHAGNLILGVGAWAAMGALPAGAGAVFFYLAAYLFISSGSFLWLKVSQVSDRAGLRGYAAARPAAAALFCALLLCLAGLPPTGGFLAKLLVFWDAVKAGLYWPVALAGLGSLVSLGYYLGLVRDMYFEAPQEPAPKLSEGSVLVFACALPAVLLGLTPWLIGLLGPR